MTVLRGFVRGYRRLVAQFVAPEACPICLDVVPVLEIRDLPSGDDQAHAKLHCRHRFCVDQLVCPVVECKQSISEGDIQHIVGSEQTSLYRAVLKRKRMRIWKNEGCNHMTCTHCRYQYCWVCESSWDASHYACYDLQFLGGSSAWGRWLQRTLGYSAIILIVAMISVFGFYSFVGVYLVFCGIVHCARRIRVGEED
ncbi:hypothetical protein BBO99_00006020 [Phytophthora kernoviae]|uniref:RING-type domain-containing protein n=2 Tax=Phytophthora kernoviae TaxID=325452 RepID=A0A421F814_9STRA|nr:hypothetical protein G195_003331 [Phytophthora kernoviae 00238/432]KAG2529313.1 hypothetical protein JM16_001849 [Phytophthora kernoviae]KAG2530401.1 hypothetical protein JM18_002274 [Phytophthora kernoviae]RLN27081.1 hypothetical protein BBI17_002527 [Phytophthora kernoviae]RLN78369.1 hypothetical protein BBO99_00006020 [Phytophthora kernoviae]